MNELETKAIAQEFADIHKAFDDVYGDIVNIAGKHNQLCDYTTDLKKSVVFASVGVVTLAIGSFCIFNVVCNQQDEISELKKEVQKLKNGRA